MSYTSDSSIAVILFIDDGSINVVLVIIIIYKVVSIIIIWHQKGIQPVKQIQQYR